MSMRLAAIGVASVMDTSKGAMKKADLMYMALSLMVSAKGNDTHYKIRT